MRRIRIEALEIGISERTNSYHVVRDHIKILRKTFKSHVVCRRAKYYDKEKNMYHITYYFVCKKHFAFRVTVYNAR